MADFLKYDHDRYLQGRSGEVEKELPLLKVENQSYIHYGKGAVVLYALQEMVGEDSVNAALRSFLQEYRYAEPPYPNSYDFMRHLRPRVPDSLQYLLTDWIETITLYDFRLKEAHYQLKADSSYQVELAIDVQKFKADTLGTEQEVAAREWVDLGFYADQDAEKLMLRKRVRLNSERNYLQFSLDSLPAKAVVDPRRIYIERLVKDNSRSLTARADSLAF